MADLLIGGGIGYPSSPETMDRLYEEAFGPSLDARKRATFFFHEKLKGILGFADFEEDNCAGSFSFTLQWKFREAKKQHNFEVSIRHRDEDSGGKSIWWRDLGDDQKKSLENDREASVFRSFFGQFDWLSRLRVWPPCVKCGGKDLTFDLAREFGDYIAFFKILQREHNCRPLLPS